MVMPIEIYSAVICYHQGGIKPKEIVLKVNSPYQTAVDLIKKWKDTGSITLKKNVQEGFKSLQNQ